MYFVKKSSVGTVSIVTLKPAAFVCCCTSCAMFAEFWLSDGMTKRTSSSLPPFDA